MTDVVIPVKELSKAKSRLQDVLDSDERASLVLAMLHDLLSTLRRCDLGDIWLVASDDVVLDLGSKYGARAIRESRSQGYNHAVSVGLNSVPAQRPVLVLPADLPMTEQSDIALLVGLKSSNAPFVGIVPDRHNRGTNGLYLSAPDLIAPVFGASSLFDHKVAATQAGITGAVISVGNMAMDIDSSDDLLTLAESGKTCATTEFLRSISFGQAPADQQKWGSA